MLTATCFPVARLLVGTRLRLNRKGFSSAKVYAERRTLTGPGSPLKPDDIAVVVHRIANIRPSVFDCLPRSLTLWCLLNRNGHRAELKIGALPRIGSGDSELKAHAWVELNGERLGERDSPEAFVELPLRANQLPNIARIRN